MAARMSCTWPRSSAASRNFHKLPFTLLEVNHGALQRGLPRGHGHGSSGSLYVSSWMVFENAEEFPTPEEHAARVPGAALGVRLVEARGRGLLPRRCTTSTGCRSRSAAPSTPTARRDARTNEPGIAHAVPDLLRKALCRAAAAADLRLGRADADAHARDDIADGIVSAHGAPGGAERGLQHLGERGADRRRDRADLLGGCGNDPADFELEHLPSSRWTCSGAGRP